MCRRMGPGGPRIGGTNPARLMPAATFRCGTGAGGGGGGPGGGGAFAMIGDLRMEKERVSVPEVSIEKAKNLNRIANGGHWI